MNKIANAAIVTMTYQCRLADGTLVESAFPAEPVQYLHGASMLLPALEAQLEGMSESESKNFTIPAKNAYGVRDESSIVTLPRSIFPSSVDLSIGARLAARTASGEAYPLTVMEIFPDRVVVDLNHPLAGQDLHFRVFIMSVRQASSN